MHMISNTISTEVKFQKSQALMIIPSLEKLQSEHQMDGMMMNGVMKMEMVMVGLILELLLKLNRHRGMCLVYCVVDCRLMLVNCCLLLVDVDELLLIFV